jgi:cystathionine beta-lyase/cystathionine gamma-synthase
MGRQARDQASEGGQAGEGHVPPGLLRLSVGCEDIDDLWNDLNSALGQATRPQNPA